MFRFGKFGLQKCKSGPVNYIPELADILQFKKNRNKKDTMACVQLLTAFWPNKGENSNNSNQRNVSRVTFIFWNSACSTLINMLVVLKWWNHEKLRSNIKKKLSIGSYFVEIYFTNKWVDQINKLSSSCKRLFKPVIIIITYYKRKNIFKVLLEWTKK